MAQAEREGVVAKVCAAEQVALHSFMVAVFDIFGQLEWRTSTHDDEPRLFFEEKPNTALNELFHKPMAGQSLEALLGQASGGDLWRRERQRLWEYAALEAGPQEETSPGASRRAHMVARKIGLTCMDASNSALEIELFMRPASAGKAIFGILVIRGETTWGQETTLIMNVPRPWATTASVAKSGGSCGSNTSSNGEEFTLPLDEATGRATEVFAWIDAQGEGMPIQKCSVGFTLLSGPSPMGVKFYDMLDDDPDFIKWLQNVLMGLLTRNEESLNLSDMETTHRVKLRHTGSSARRLLAIRAECQLDLKSTMEGPADGSPLHQDGGKWPALLVFRNVMQHKRKSEKNRHSWHIQIRHREETSTSKFESL